jgi:hypothetical protein
VRATFAGTPLRHSAAAGSVDRFGAPEDPVDKLRRTMSEGDRRSPSAVEPRQRAATCCNRVPIFIAVREKRRRVSSGLAAR